MLSWLYIFIRVQRKPTVLIYCSGLAAVCLAFVPSGQNMTNIDTQYTRPPDRMNL